MSEYQYYEFYSISTPMSSEARKKMASLSSRPKINTHGASYVYHYGDFKGDPKSLTLKYFDVFFYISNFGMIEFIFKYPLNQINADAINEYCKEDIISTKIHNDYFLLQIETHDENGFGLTEGEELLPEFLPLYEEIKSGNYQLLKMVHSIHAALNEEGKSMSHLKNKNSLSKAQKKLLNVLLDLLVT